MKNLKKIIQNIDAILACSGLALTIVIQALNVFSRYFFRRSFASAEELAYLGFAYTICLGVAYIYRKRAMISIEFVANKFPEKVQEKLELINYIILTVVCAILTYQSVQLSIIGWKKFTTALRLRYTFIDLAAVLGFGLMTIYSAKFIVDLLRHKKLSEPDLEDKF